MKEKDCVFCHIDRKPLYENDYFYLIESKFPVTENGHFLIIPKDHLVEWSYVILNPHRQIDFMKCWYLGVLKLEDSGFRDYNAGLNRGKLAGQTIPHIHFHLIGRVEGDVKDPRGGIRNIIPSKGNYLKTN